MMSHLEIMNNPPKRFLEPWGILFAIVIGYLGIGLIIFADFTLMMAGIGLVILAISLSQLLRFDEKRKVKKWKEHLMETLPIEKRFVSQISRELDFPQVYEDELKERLMMYQKQELNGTEEFLVASFKEHDSQWQDSQIRGFYRINRTLPEGEIPYVEYQYIPNSLPHGIHYGFYNLTLYVPENHHI